MANFPLPALGSSWLISPKNYFKIFFLSIHVRRPQRVVLYCAEEHEQNYFMLFSLALLRMKIDKRSRVAKLFIREGKIFITSN